ncbi:hypothetical protein BCT38_07060 [Vibrio lentus]|nr:hypothetical protein BH583_15640 [Vibrio lentus]PMN11531.1 hypothetical protein BCT38_07060 [Vibrio lentus]
MYYLFAILCVLLSHNIAPFSNALMLQPSFLFRSVVTIARAVPVNYLMIFKRLWMIEVEGKAILKIGIKTESVVERMIRKSES